jgi:hypothetical protein
MTRGCCSGVGFGDARGSLNSGISTSPEKMPSCSMGLQTQMDGNSADVFASTDPSVSVLDRRAQDIPVRLGGDDTSPRLSPSPGGIILP